MRITGGTGPLLGPRGAAGQHRGARAQARTPSPPSRRCGSCSATTGGPPAGRPTPTSAGCARCAAGCAPSSRRRPAATRTRAVDLLNALLLEFPVSPQVSGHGDPDAQGRPQWHMHLADHASNATAAYTATACMGLAVQLTGLGVDRLGVCRGGAVPQRLPRHLHQPVPPLLLRPLRHPGQRRRLPGPQAPGGGRRLTAPQRTHRRQQPAQPLGGADPPYHRAAGSGRPPGPAAVRRGPRRTSGCRTRRTRCPPAPTSRPPGAPPRV